MDSDHDLLVRIDERVKRSEIRLENLEESVDNIERQTQRWKGASALLIALGGLAGWLLPFLWTNRQ